VPHGKRHVKRHVKLIETSAEERGPVPLSGAFTPWMCAILNIARWPQQLRADFHEGRDFRKNIQINITRLYKNTKTKKEELLCNFKCLPD
jgi:hypothetical protein